MHTPGSAICMHVFLGLSNRIPAKFKDRKLQKGVKIPRYNEEWKRVCQEKLWKGILFIFKNLVGAKDSVSSKMKAWNVYLLNWLN